MRKDENTQKAFFELLRAGLWERDVELKKYGTVDFSEILQLATEQSVVGLVAAGLEHVKDVKVPQEWALQLAGQTLQLEQRNKAMNTFIAELIEKLRKADIYTLLVKGQGIAQCYERPLWRACGDVDLFLSLENYRKAQQFLIPVAYDIEEENPKNLHQAMTIDGWCVELHGTLRSQLGKRIDRTMDDMQADVFCGGNVRSWYNGRTQVFLPSVDNDVILVFTHILQHFFGGGIGLRQICDWCRLLYTFRKELNRKLLEQRLRKMGLITEWKAFATLAVEYMGMPADAMPLNSGSTKWVKKADRILSLVMESGNFGHGRDKSYKKKYPKLIEYLISFGGYTRYGINQFMVFPRKALRGWGRTIRLGVTNKLKKR